jgi:hypothetical protein
MRTTLITLSNVTTSVENSGTTVSHGFSTKSDESLVKKYIFSNEGFAR